MVTRPQPEPSLIALTIAWAIRSPHELVFALALIAGALWSFSL